MQLLLTTYTIKVVLKEKLKYIGQPEFIFFVYKCRWNLIFGERLEAFVFVGDYHNLKETLFVATTSKPWTAAIQE